MIGHAVSNGCIRLTNDDVIDLYDQDARRDDGAGRVMVRGRCCRFVTRGNPIREVSFMHLAAIRITVI